LVWQKVRFSECFWPLLANTKAGPIGLSLNSATTETIQHSTAPILGAQFTALLGQATVKGAKGAAENVEKLEILENLPRQCEQGRTFGVALGTSSWIWEDQEGSQ